jgi:YccS/YhfK family integral membrane protein
MAAMGSFAAETFRQRLGAWARRGQPLRVLIALGGVLALCGSTGRFDALIPLFLGVIASALAETDDSWRGRLRAQFVTLICFAVAAFAVTLLFDKPLVFVIALAAAAFGLTMLGAVEARYKAIGQATLLLVLFAALAADNAPVGGVAHRREAWLVAGAGWYGVLSVLWCAYLPAQPVQARLVRLFAALGDYMRFQAAPPEPLHGIDAERERLSLALLNAEVVAELNAVKESILRRLGARAPTGRIARYRSLYLIAQDLHERASASYDDQRVPADAFYGDLMDRCRRVLGSQGQACTRLARAIERDEPFAVDAAASQALAELRKTIAHERRAAATPPRLALLAPLEALAQNLAQLDAQLANAVRPAAPVVRTDLGALERPPRSGRDAGERVKRQLTPRSALFRHAVRLSLALALGYGAMRLIHPGHGYWILMTSLFVCQQSYGETVSRMGERMAGTVLGLLLGWGLLQLSAQPMLQSAAAVLAGVVFFSTRSTRYVLATAAITLMVLLCANQVGPGLALIVPRLVDTAIGCVIAALAVLLVLPHWQARRINELAATAVRDHAVYLRRVVEQYRAGPRDDLVYRLARRNAHNADAALSTAVAALFRASGRMRPHGVAARRFGTRSHALLGYLSTLGAHRAALPDPHVAVLLREAAEGAAAALEALARGLERGTVDATDIGPDFAMHVVLGVEAPIAGDPEADGAAPLVRTELSLIWLQIEALRRHAREWLRRPEDMASEGDGPGIRGTRAG